MSTSTPFVTLTENTSVSKSKSSFAPYVPVPLVLRILSILRTVWIMLVVENPLLWALRQGRNRRADFEGPYFTLGAPNRQYGVNEGKAVLASPRELRDFPPFLALISIRTPKGAPVPYARFQWWQANTNGGYAHTSYALRGTFAADKCGNIEVLTVAPGAYGPKGHMRAAHFHLRIEPTRDGLNKGGKDKQGSRCKYEPLTTQIYVCPRNDASVMQPDLVNLLRAPRASNMMDCWSASKATNREAYQSLPELPSEDAETARKIDWWNSRIAEETGDESIKIAAGGHTVLALTCETH